jgi:hypothetical protein
LVVSNLVVYLYSDNNNEKTEVMRKLTAEYAKRVERELENTKNLLAKEMKISADLRYNDMVAFYEKHILKLETMLATGQW